MTYCDITECSFLIFGLKYIPKFLIMKIRWNESFAKLLIFTLTACNFPLKVLIFEYPLIKIFNYSKSLIAFGSKLDPPIFMIEFYSILVLILNRNILT